MSPFLEWLVALVIGAVMAIAGLFVAAYASTYFSIWLAGFVLFILFLGAIAGLYFVSSKGGK